MAFAEDFTAFLSPEEFATTVTVGGVPVDAIFDRAYDRADIGVGVASTVPILRLPTAQVPASLMQAAVQVGDEAFRVAEHQPDGTGMSVLFLERAR